MSRARERWEAFWRAIPRRAPLVLALLALPTLLALAALVEPSGRLRLRVDASADRLLPVDAPSRALHDRVQRLFGSDRALVVVLALPDVFSREGLEAIAHVSSALEELPEVEQVLSLATANHVHAVDGDIAVEPFLEEIPADAAGLAALRAAVLGNPLYAGSLVSRDGRSAALVARLGDLSDEGILRHGTDRGVEAAAREALGALPGAAVYLTGGPHIQAESARVLLAESLSLPGLTLLVMTGILILAFRTLRGVLVPLATIALGVLWTLGLAVAVGHALNAVTVLVPPLLVTLGLSYAVHVVSEYYEAFREHPGGAPRAVAGASLAGAALPLATCGLTTAIGFGTLLLSPLAAVRDFGWLALAGTVFTLVAALTFAPAALALLPPPRRMPPASGGRATAAVDGLFGALGRLVVEHRRAVFAAALAVFALSLAGALRMRVGSQQIEKFRADAPVRAHFEAVNERFGGVNPITVVLDTDETEAFKEPERLRAVKALQGWLEEQPEVSDATSLVDVVEVANRAFHGDDPAALAIPESRRLVSQLLFAGAGGELDGFVDARFQTLAVHLRTSAVDSAEIAALVARIEVRLAELPAPLRGAVTGTSVVFNAALDEIIHGQATSLVTGLWIIYAILAVVFVSAWIGLVALVPNVLPIAFYFGLLGWSGVLLSPGTSLVAPIVLGIAVDDTIHYFARFIEDARRQGSERLATESALRAVGRPVTYTALALCAGFLVWNLSEFRTQGELGTLAAATLAFGWLADVTLTPALCVGLRIVTLWELLALDLGAAPQRTIRLFRGLSDAQARIVALMGRLVPVKAGERLWSAGEPADALYVVIDGRLRASLAGPYGVRELGVHERGDLVGEVGLVQQARSADVDALEDGRLLRLGREHFAQLRRRYPRIAAAVLANLSEVLAERLVRRTREAAGLG